VLQTRGVHPGSEIFHPGYPDKEAPDPGSATKNLNILNPKIVTIFRGMGG
jgi:hypothetical protein